jgi:hypothetical protein
MSEKTKIELTFMGRRFNRADGKLSYHYREADGKTATFGKRVTGRVIGGVFELDATRGTGDAMSVVLNSWRYLNTLQDEVLLAEWTMADAAAFDVAENQKLGSKIPDVADLRLRDLARLYRRSSRIHQRAILARIFNVLDSARESE